MMSFKYNYKTCKVNSTMILISGGNDETQREKGKKHTKLIAATWKLINVNRANAFG